MATVGTLHAPGGLTLELDGTDMLWAARMVVGEEPPGAGRAQALTLVSTLLRRWAAINRARVRRGAEPLWPRFRDLLIDFSQPLHDTHSRARRIQSLGWGEIPVSVRRAVRDVMTGRVPLSQRGTGAVNFAEESFARSRWQPDWQEVSTPSANLVLSTRAGRALPREPRVTPQNNTGLLASLVLSGASVAGAAAIVRSSPPGM